MINVGLTERQFIEWASENGWSVPKHVRWSFVPEMKIPSVSNAAHNAIRVWPASLARTGTQPMAMFRGRVELRDGCFFVGEFGKPVDKLAWFHAEVGFDLDHAGFYILRDRVTGMTLTRLGEDMNWGGPASAVIGEEVKQALHAACGPGAIYVVGSPQSSERFLMQNPHLRQTQVPPPSFSHRRN